LLERFLELPGTLDKGHVCLADVSKKESEQTGWDERTWVALSP